MLIIVQRKGILAHSWTAFIKDSGHILMPATLINCLCCWSSVMETTKVSFLEFGGYVCQFGTDKKKPLLRNFNSKESSIVTVTHLFHCFERYYVQIFYQEHSVLLSPTRAQEITWSNIHCVTSTSNLNSFWFSLQLLKY